MTRGLRGWWVFACTALFLVQGCVRGSVAKPTEDIRTMREQRDPEKLTRAAEAWAAFGEPGRAAQYFELALENGGNEAKNFPRLIATLIRDKQYRAAVLAAEERLRSHPADASLRFVTGGLHASLGDTVDARREFETVIRAEPSNAEAHYALAVVLREGQRDLAAADLHFRRYLELSPEGPHAEEAKSLLLSQVP